MQVQSKGRAAEVVDLLKATAAETGSKGGGSLEGGSEDVEWISTAHLHAAEHTVVLCDALKRKDRPPDASEHLGFCLVLALICSWRLSSCIHITTNKVFRGVHSAVACSCPNIWLGLPYDHHDLNKFH
eukprot:scaffold70963_cov20-Tisochrysis_lutea.AAC.8